LKISGANKKIGNLVCLKAEISIQVASTREMKVHAKINKVEEWYINVEQEMRKMYKRVC